GIEYLVALLKSADCCHSSGGLTIKAQTPRASFLRNLSLATGLNVCYNPVMKRWQQNLKGSLFVGLLVCFGAITGRVAAADSLSWQTNQNKVSAEITSWDLPKLLKKIATATGWQIYLEPQTELKVSTKFKDRTPGEALGLLLGDLSFALVPPTNGP